MDKCWLCDCVTLVVGKKNYLLHSQFDHDNCFFVYTGPDEPMAPGADILLLRVYFNYFNYQYLFLLDGKIIKTNFY